VQVWAPELLEAFQSEKLGAEEGKDDDAEEAEEYAIEKLLDRRETEVYLH
jgi:hypothetical protein